MQSHTNSQTQVCPEPLRMRITVSPEWRLALKYFSELALAALCGCCYNYTVLMSPNQDVTALHGCFLHLHCSSSGDTVIRMRKGAGQTCV